MILKNTLTFISGVFFLYKYSNKKILFKLKSLYNNKISKIDHKTLEYKSSPNLLDCIIKYDREEEENRGFLFKFNLDKRKN